MSPKHQPKNVPPTSGTALQQKTESKLEQSLGSRFDIQLEQKMGNLQSSMLEAIKSWEDFQKSILKTFSQVEVNQISASASKPGLSNPVHLDCLARSPDDNHILQPHIGETRCQELRNSSFWPSSLFKSQLVKEGEVFLKKGTSKDCQGFGPYQNKPFLGSHKKRGSYRKRPYGAIPLKAVTSRFPQEGGN